MTDPIIVKNLKHNFLVNTIDGGFFGFALGFASFVTTIPLFVATMTDSAVLIGLIPAIHNVGWQLPQLLTAYSVSQQARYKPMVLKLTLLERLPFLLLAAIAWFIPAIGASVGLTLTYLFLIVQGLGAGVTATAWQSMIGKIFPAHTRGSFYGVQAASANLLASISAIAAGLILARMESPEDFTLIFLCASASLLISWLFLAQTREPESQENVLNVSQAQFWAKTALILKNDRNFIWFLISRVLGNFGTMAFAFYTVYAVKIYDVSEAAIGVMTAVYMATQIITNPLMGWIGDRWSHRGMLVLGMLSVAVSALLAVFARSTAWFFPMFVFAGIGNVAFWTVGLAMILGFGPPDEKPAYIGLANTLVAPATIVAPLLAGWIVDIKGYSAAFWVSTIGAILAAATLAFFVKDQQLQKI